MEKITYKITGVEPLLLNNPQTVDPFNKFARAKKNITNKRKKTDDDLIELRRLEVESKLYFDDVLKVYVPSTWVIAALAGNSWAKVKIKKAEIRSCVFCTESKLKLIYDGIENVKTIEDICANPFFVKTLLLKQGQVRVPKNAPIFHGWSFSGEIEFDSGLIDRNSLTTLLDYAASYGGFGDFRPTFGRSRFEETSAIRKVA